MPDKPFSWVPKENLLSFEELFRFVKICIDKGVNKIRITGGEPTLRADIVDFIAMISNYKNDIDLAMTTNAYLFDKFAKPLKEAGLKRVNISLDTLDEDVALQISQKNILSKVLTGIQCAIDVGLEVKLNAVILKDINENEVINLVEFAKKGNMPIRFIQYMENTFANDKLKGLSAKEVKDIISTKYNFKDVGKDANAPAHYYELDDGYKFGTIEPYKEDFCQTCNRIRLTAEGVIVPCLYFDEGKSIREAIRNKDIDKAVSILDNVLANKPEKNKWSNDDNKTSDRAFYVTGG
jgi:cyclic pyranopterin phosphate synthase